VASRDARGGHSRLLYHYTDGHGLAELVGSGVLPPADLVIRHRSVRFKRPLTWLTDDPDPASPAVLAIARLRHGAQISVRLSVAAAGAQRWSVWAPQHGVPHRHWARLDELCDGLSSRLWVVPTEIPATDWIVAEDPLTRAVLWRNDLLTAS
jgi:hypothetical protein